MRMIQDMFIKIGNGHLGGGTVVHQEDLIGLPGVKYAQIENVTFGYKFNPAGYKRTVTHYVARFELEIHEGKEYWNETSYISCKNKAEAKRVYKATVTDLIKSLKG